VKYIPVTGLGPVAEVKHNILTKFNAALISIAEPTTSKSWTIHQVYKQVEKIFKNFDGGEEIYLDSGGFQVLMNHITVNRMREFTDVYHFMMDKFSDDISKKAKIFSLDILNKKFTEEQILKFNDYSINSSIKLLKKKPELRYSQLFVVQSRFPRTLEIWKDLIKKHNIFEHYHRYSFGGLVGLKKETNAKFNHFVPMTYWLFGYAKHLGYNNPVKHIHMLGQSSRLAIITATLMEEILDFEITMDSSEILRFSPIEAKLPLIYLDEDNEFRMAKTKEDLAQMLINSHKDKVDGYCIDTQLKLLQEEGKVSNPDFVEVVCQGIDSTVEFSKWFIDHVRDKIKDETIFNITEVELKELHPVFKQGRLAKEFVNNLIHMKTCSRFLKEDDFEGLDNYVMSVIKGYYE
jgi:hypothetical protein